MRALHQVVLSRISSYSFGDQAALDASTVQLAVSFTYKDPHTGVTAGGPDEQLFVFVQDGREWKMDCGPRLTVAQDTKTNDINLGIPRLLNLAADKCIPWKTMAPIMEELKKEYADKFVAEFIDVWQNESAGTQYAVKMIPTQIFLDATGKELFRHEGFFSKDDILGKWKELGVDVDTLQP